MYVADTELDPMVSCMELPGTYVPCDRSSAANERRGEGRQWVFFYVCGRKFPLTELLDPYRTPASVSFPFSEKTMWKVPSSRTRMRSD